MTFPTTPVLNQVHTTTRGLSYQWNGDMWKAYISPSSDYVGASVAWQDTTNITVTKQLFTTHNHLNNATVLAPATNKVDFGLISDTFLDTGFVDVANDQFVVQQDGIYRITCVFNCRCPTFNALLQASVNGTDIVLIDWTYQIGTDISSIGGSIDYQLSLNDTIDFRISGQPNADMLAGRASIHLLNTQ